MAPKRTYNMERFFQALGDATRLRLLALMTDQEICVCYFVEILDASQPKISRHLAYLRSAGLVEARRDGKWMHYKLAFPPHLGAERILRQTLDWLREERTSISDRAKLTKMCCAPEKYVTLAGAPKPLVVSETCVA
jgi:ArsR family transcriptional regulator